MASEQLLIGSFSLEGPFPGQTRQLQLAIVGGGGIARVHSWAAGLSERWQIAAVAPSANADRARELARNGAWRGCRIYGSYPELLEAVRQHEIQVDAVAIAVPNHLHYEVARACLDSGVHVMCEKPLTNDLDAARDLANRTEASSVVFCVAYPYGSFPMVRQARHLIRSGVVGRVRQVHVEFVQDYLLNQTPASTAPWRNDPVRAGAGSSADIGTHAFHLVEFVADLPIERIRAEFHVSGPPRSMEDTFYAFVRAKGDVPGTLWGSQVAAGISSGPRFRIIGEGGTLEWDNASPQSLQCEWLDQPAQTFTRGRGRGLGPAAERFTRRPRGNTEGWVEAWANLYTEFALAIAARADGIAVPDGVLEYPDVRAGVRGVRFVEAAAASAQAEGAWMEIFK